MSLRRSLSWSAVTRDIRAARVQASPKVRRTVIRREAFANAAAAAIRAEGSAHTLIAADRSFDRSAIMRAAIKAAKAQRGVTGEPWSVCLSAALKGVWKVAKAVRPLVH